MVTTCSAIVCVETNTFLHIASSNPNFLYGNSSMSSIKGELEVVTNFQDDVSCGQDAMSECSFNYIAYAML
jgi:hypothetical protein